MDNNNEVNLQNVDNEAPRVVSDSLRNSVVLREILEHFSSKDLRQLSFVNKGWKCEAQSLMRKRGHFTAYVKSNKDPCDQDQVDAFISDLKQMNPVPFSGISIDIHVPSGLGPLPIPALDPLQGVKIDQPALKTVSVRLEGSWPDNMASPGVLLTKKVLQDCSGALEELELKVELAWEDFLEKVLQDVTFPHLKILKLREFHHTGCTDELGYANYMKAMLSRAPNLQVLHSNWSINFMLSILEGSSVLPVYGSRVNAPFEEISEDAVSVIRLEDMKLLHTGPQFNFERFNRIAPMLLRASCATTLRCMKVDAVLAIPLMCYRIRLKNVKVLCMAIHHYLLERSEPRILRVVKNFDFTHIFPNLNKVKIVPFHRVHLDSQNEMSRFIERADAVLREPMPDRAINVRTLDLNQWTVDSSAAQFFAEMFPSIEKLDITTNEGIRESISFETIWKSWLDLKEFNVRGILLRFDRNLDSAFCGIFPEEVAELREKDDEFLKRVNIVPVMPALTCLRNLRTLFVNHKDPFYSTYSDDVTFLFSKVTALLVYARMPSLAVSLKVSDAVLPTMTHLEPYVSVLHDTLEDEWFQDA